IPLALTASVAAFFGMGTEYSPLVSVLRFIMMCCVGFLEEVIFRGFLFRGIAKENLTRAVIISSLTFGIGHFVNILNGSDLFENSVQVVYAAAVAFLLVLIFLRTSSILPCIAFHAFNNCLTAFTTGDILTGRLGERNSALLVVGIKILIAGAYLLYVSRLPKRDLPTD
ncbi:MAG: CPBP family intramembrane metalloprotease, partial [Ruminococcus sp.]|nr:CPBP family intramembrane metalloprotease [Ruminococcus sp.]